MWESEVSCRITATRCRALTNTFVFVPLCTGIATQLLSNRVTARARFPSVALDCMPRAVVGATVRYRLGTLLSLSNLSNPKQQTLETHTRNLKDCMMFIFQKWTAWTTPLDSWATEPSVH